MFRRIVLTLAIAVTFALPARAAATRPSTRPAMADEYLDLITTYCIYARSIWHDAEPGGYWGFGGLEEKNDNGRVRAMANTMLAYAMLVHARDAGWLTDARAKQLDQA